MEIQILIDAFVLESRALDATLRLHPRLRPLFTGGSVDARLLEQTYLRLLKLTADYVQYTVPALYAAGIALRDGDDEDRAWSEHLLGYSAGETDEVGDYGHHIWALDDMRALGAPHDLIESPPHEIARLYGQFFIDGVRLHPYAILGAKGVLEHFSIRVSDDLVRGVIESGIPSARNAVTFFEHHGVLDIEHVREGDRNLAKLHVTKRLQVLHGAYFTSGMYRSLLDQVLPPCGADDASSPLLPIP